MGARPGDSDPLGKLLEELGWAPYRSWDAGRSWRLSAAYAVPEQLARAAPSR